MIINGNNLEVLDTFPDNYFDSVVTDPPYGLKFMGKKWDYDVPSVELWQKVYRVLKPGGHVLSFGGSRTYHRMAIAIEDAGFEIRDMIEWVYGSGFPKSLNIGKAVDKTLGAEREKVRITENFRNPKSINGGNGIEGGDRPWLIKAREIGYHEIDSNVPATEQAKLWEGYGTALKPAHEPCVLARKPIEGNVAQNCLKYGVGGLNIDGSRVKSTGETMSRPYNKINDENVWNSDNSGYKKRGNPNNVSDQLGRFPANLIHDGSDEVLEVFPNNSARFFYCAKVSQSERNIGFEGKNNPHPTVKPIALMSYLVKLITPKGGIVLDPFNGSGSTGIACKKEGMEYVGIELDPEYCEISEARIKAFNKPLI